ILQHAGLIDGFRCHFTLVPKERLGIVLLCNLHKTQMNIALSNGLLEMLLKLPHRDWNAVIRAAERKNAAIEAKESEDRRREEFLGAVAMMVLNNDLSEAVFKKFELALKYGKNMRMDDLKDSLSLALLDWVRKGGLEGNWKAEKAKCPRCSHLATNFDSGNQVSLTVCPNCNS
ncbi:MAG: hypothetical protein OK455_10400, partial [Thaumarchaeota archaeon]|nr:hypothetical protein [Nitrososphaerota archaeon]